MTEYRVVSRVEAVDTQPRAIDYSLARDVEKSVTNGRSFLHHSDSFSADWDTDCVLQTRLARMEGKWHEALELAELQTHLSKSGMAYDIDTPQKVGQALSFMKSVQFSAALPIVPFEIKRSPQWRDNSPIRNLVLEDRSLDALLREALLNHSLIRGGPRSDNFESIRISPSGSLNDPKIYHSPWDRVSDFPCDRVPDDPAYLGKYLSDLPKGSSRKHF
jgi:hypothetical protein